MTSDSAQNQIYENSGPNSSPDSNYNLERLITETTLPQSLIMNDLPLSNSNPEARRSIMLQPSYGMIPSATLAAANGLTMSIMTPKGLGAIDEGHKTVGNSLESRLKSARSGRNNSNPHSARGSMQTTVMKNLHQTFNMIQNRKIDNVSSPVRCADSLVSRLRRRNNRLDRSEDQPVGMEEATVVQASTITAPSTTRGTSQVAKNSLELEIKNIHPVRDIRLISSPSKSSKMDNRTPTSAPSNSWFRSGHRKSIHPTLTYRMGR